MEINNNLNIKAALLKTGEAAKTEKPPQSQAAKAAIGAQTSTAQAQLKDIAKEILLSLGLGQSPENLRALGLVMNNGEAVNKSNLSKFAQWDKMFTAEGDAPALSQSKAGFLLKNAMALDSAPALSRFLNEKSSLAGNLNKLLDIIDNIPDPAVKTGLMEIFAENPEADMPLQSPAAREPSKTQATPPKTEALSVAQSPEEATPKESVPQKTAVEENAPPQTEAPKENEAPKSTAPNTQAEANESPAAKETAQKSPGETAEELELVFPEPRARAEKPPSPHREITGKFLLKLAENIKDSRPEEVDGILNNLRLKLDKALKLSPKGAYPELEQAVSELKSDLKFINDIKTCVYLPLPIKTPDGHSEGELYVFRDKRKKSRGESVSALVALNTANLGRVETYIQKTGPDLNLQFRLEDSELEGLFRENAEKLNTLLGLYHIRGLSFITMDAPFNLLSASEPQKTSEIEGLSLDIKA